MESTQQKDTVGRVFEWFAQRERIAEAESAPGPSAVQREALRRADSLLKVLSTFSDLSNEDRVTVSTPLLREAIGFAAVALTDQRPGTFREAMDLLVSNDQVRAIKCADVAAAARDALVERGFADSAAQRGATLAGIDAAEQLVIALVNHLNSTNDGPARARIRRNLRLALAALVVATPFIWIGWSLNHAVYLHRHAPIDVTPHWRASSGYDDFPSSGQDQTARKWGIFFHTAGERQPWIEFDLGRQESIGSVEIINRADEAGRASPMVVETSNDARSWKTVARNDSSFGAWRPTFDPILTRFVRLRVDRDNTYLHLERVLFRR